jgi:hypothetical protein
MQQTTETHTLETSHVLSNITQDTQWTLLAGRLIEGRQSEEGQSRLPSSLVALNSRSQIKKIDVDGNKVQEVKRFMKPLKPMLGQSSLSGWYVKPTVE